MNCSRILWLNIIYRNMSTSRRGTAKENFYDYLEIKSKATHNEIKSAYFKLSKQYHPDMNSSKEAKVKFNEISTAYEVLGNHEKRKQYDRGLRVTSMSHEEPEIIIKQTNMTDIAEESKRVHSELNRVRTQADGSPIYNFDLWNDMHYAKLLERRRKDLSDYKFHRHEREKEKIGRIAARFDMSIFAIFLCTTFILMCLKMQYFENLDTPIIKLDGEKTKHNDFAIEKRQS